MQRATGKFHNVAPGRMADLAMYWTPAKKAGLIDPAHAQSGRMLRMINPHIPALLSERWQAE